MKFENIYKETEENMRLALLSLWAPGSHPMRSAIDELLIESLYLLNQYSKVHLVGSRHQMKHGGLLSIKMSGISLKRFVRTRLSKLAKRFVHLSHSSIRQRVGKHWQKTKVLL